MTRRKKTSVVLPTDWIKHIDPNNITEYHKSLLYQTLAPQCSDKCKKACARNPKCFFGYPQRRYTRREPLKDTATTSSARSRNRIPCPYAGLLNKKNICYMNCPLQLYFHDKKFRRMIYEWDPLHDSKEQIAFKACPDKAKYTPKSALGNLQMLFAQMEFGVQAYVDPTAVVNSFNINANKQEDSAEFYQLFMAHFETNLLTQHNEEIRNFITKRYKGLYSYVTTCKQCRTISRLPSQYTSLALNVVDHQNIYESLRQFFDVENLSDNNQYHCNRCGFNRDATRWIEMDVLPPVLTLQLMRLDFNKATGQKRKLRNLIKFPEILEMARVLERESEELRRVKFKLKAIVIHLGTADYGHYTAQIYDKQTERWYKYDDQIVTPLTSEAQRYGLIDPLNYVESKLHNVAKPTIGCMVSDNAYMLVYTKCVPEEQAEPDTYASINETPLPHYVKNVVLEGNHKVATTKYNKTVTNDDMIGKFYDIALNYDNEYDFICRHWLLKYLNNIRNGNFERIDHSKYVCPHNKLNPDYVLSMRIISKESADIIYAVAGGGPRFTEDSRCDDCVRISCKVLQYGVRLRSANNTICRHLGEYNKRPHGKSYFIGCETLHHWRKMTIARYKRRLVRESTENRDNTETESQAENSEVAEPVEPEIEDEEFNREMLCIHKQLNTETNLRRKVPQIVIDILSEYFEAAANFPTPLNPCTRCSYSGGRIVNIDEYQKLLKKLRKNLASILTGKRLLNTDHFKITYNFIDFCIWTWMGMESDVAQYNDNEGSDVPPEFIHCNFTTIRALEKIRKYLGHPRIWRDNNYNSDICCMCGVNMIEEDSPDVLHKRIYYNELIFMPKFRQFVASSANRCTDLHIALTETQRVLPPTVCIGKDIVAKFLHCLNTLLESSPLVNQPTSVAVIKTMKRLHLKFRVHDIRLNKDWIPDFKNLTHTRTLRSLDCITATKTNCTSAPSNEPTRPEDLIDVCTNEEPFDTYLITSSDQIADSDFVEEVSNAEAMAITTHYGMPNVPDVEYYELDKFDGILSSPLKINPCDVMLQAPPGFVYRIAKEMLQCSVLCEKCRTRSRAPVTGFPANSCYEELKNPDMQLIHDFFLNPNEERRQHLWFLVNQDFVTALRAFISQSKHMPPKTKQAVIPSDLCVKNRVFLCEHGRLKHLIQSKCFWAVTLEQWKIITEICSVDVPLYVVEKDKELLSFPGICHRCLVVDVEYWVKVRYLETTEEINDLRLRIISETVPEATAVYEAILADVLDEEQCKKVEPHLQHRYRTKIGRTWLSRGKNAMGTSSTATTSSATTSTAAASAPTASTSGIHLESNRDVGSLDNPKPSCSGTRSSARTSTYSSMGPSTSAHTLASRSGPPTLANIAADFTMADSISSISDPTPSTSMDSSPFPASASRHKPLSSVSSTLSMAGLRISSQKVPGNRRPGAIRSRRLPATPNYTNRDFQESLLMSIHDKKFPNMREAVFYLQASSTIQELKLQIMSTFHVPVYDQRLYRNGVELTLNQQPLYIAGFGLKTIVDLTTVILKPKAEEGLQSAAAASSSTDTDAALTMDVDVKPAADVEIKPAAEAAAKPAADVDLKRTADAAAQTAADVQMKPAMDMDLDEPRPKKSKVQSFDFD